MSTVYVRFEIEPFSADDGFAVCEFVDGEPVRQVTVVGGRPRTATSSAWSPPCAATFSLVHNMFSTPAACTRSAPER
jgi:hypothetical protein